MNDVHRIKTMHGNLSWKAQVFKLAKTEVNGLMVSVIQNIHLLTVCSIHRILK